MCGGDSGEGRGYREREGAGEFIARKYGAILYRDYTHLATLKYLISNVFQTIGMPISHSIALTYSGPAWYWYCLDYFHSLQV